MNALCFGFCHSYHWLLGLVPHLHLLDGDYIFLCSFGHSHRLLGVRPLLLMTTASSCASQSLGVEVWCLWINRPVKPKLTRIWSVSISIQPSPFCILTVAGTVWRNWPSESSNSLLPIGRISVSQFTVGKRGFCLECSLTLGARFQWPGPLGIIK